MDSIGPSDPHTPQPAELAAIGEPGHAESMPVPCEPPTAALASDGRHYTLDRSLSGFRSWLENQPADANWGCYKPYTCVHASYYLSQGVPEVSVSIGGVSLSHDSENMLPLIPWEQNFEHGLGYTNGGRLVITRDEALELVCQIEEGRVYA